jgi:hypothetical protein
MAGSLQAVFMNQRSFSEPLPTVIGQAYGGGFWAGYTSTTANGVATHFLIVSPLSSGQNSSIAWKTENTATDNVESLIDGLANTNNMNNATHPAAQFCRGRTIGSYTDWYMPAKNELDVCYFNLKPTTASNDTSSGINANSVPKRNSNFTSGTPSQTSAADFQVDGSQFMSGRYWSSTQGASSRAQVQVFSNGYQYGYGNKTSPSKVRAVRKVAV